MKCIQQPIMTTSFAGCPTSFGGPAPKAKVSAYQSVNPYDGKSFKAFEELTDRQLETAIKSAATCFEAWRNVSFSERKIAGGAHCLGSIKTTPFPSSCGQREKPQR